MEGFVPGTPAFENQLLERKVRLCQEMRGVESCEMCEAVDSCSVRQEYLFKVLLRAPGGNSE